MEKKGLLFAVALFAFPFIWAQTAPTISIQNIDFSINPEFNNWRHNADADTFLVVPITMDDFVDSVDSFSFNLIYDPLKMNPLANGYEINHPDYILEQNYLAGIPFPMVDGRYFSMENFFIPDGNKMLTINYSDSFAFTSGGHGNSNGVLLYVPFKTIDKCRDGTDSVLAWNGYVDSTSSFINPAQPNTFILSGTQGVISADNGTLNLNNGSLAFAQLEAVVTEFSGNLESLANNGTAPFQFEWSTGETTQNITPVSSGDYWVIITDAMGCRDTSSIYSYSLSVGFVEQRDNNVVVYPNPFTNVLRIKVDGSVTVVLFDLLGNKLAIATGNDEVGLYRKDLKPGVYLLKIDLEGETVYEKVAIN
jgi:hypothetical protein